MPHTISPDPSSQGLGITYSTLSPPPAEPSVPRFTGMVPQGPHSSPPRLPPATHLHPSYRPQPSPTRGQQPLGQPSFQLRPTHTRTGSSGTKGFSTFSAIPPSPARPMGPRAASVLSHSPKLGGPSSRSESEHSQIPSTEMHPDYEDEQEQQELEAEDETPKQSLRPLPTPTRSASIASHITTASKQLSDDMRRKFSKDTFGGGGAGGVPGKYFPLSGEDDLVYENEQETHQHHLEPSSTAVEASPMNQPTSHPRRPSTRMTNTSGSGFTSGPMHASPSKASSSQSHHSNKSYSAYQAEQFPYPPEGSHHPRSATTYSDPTNNINHAYHRYQSYAQEYLPPLQHRMSRSKSQPQYLYGVPDIDSDERQTRAPPTSIPNPDPMMTTKRSSNISSGIHSKNAVLLSAESGGMMLAFSPTGDGTFRPGEMICGSGTGLLPSSIQSPPSIESGSRSQEELAARPWSESSLSHENAPTRKPTVLGHRGRSLSDGAQLLARQGTLLHPSSSKQRSSAELNVLLGGPKSRRLSANKLLPPPPTEEDQNANTWQKDNKVRLEVSKKGKARVEVDVVLERECVVEGGEVRGRMEVRITGGKRGEGLRVGAGKVRVVGFEELSPTTRHIFYHQPHPLPVFDPAIQHNLSSSLFASGPDSDGYRLASEGTHNIPFRMRLPLGSGAKGTYTTPNGKGPCVRYVVVGSVKIHIPSTGKRSIAHFYRSIVVLPYLNPGLVLAPSNEPVEGYVERGLGWNITGEKGRVELRVSLGRRIWVSGQRLWCEVAIRNDSNRKIKTLNLALLQTVQVFNPQPLLDTADLPGKLIGKRRSMSACLDPATVPGTPDLDACQTTTQRRKVSEELIEADFISHGAGRVTGKGWWTGVDTGESGHWDLSLQIPPGMLSIRRTRLIEIQYTLRVTVNGSIYVDVPVQLINFLSIDPPPMPRDGPGLLNPPVSNKQNIPNINSCPQDLQVTIGGLGGVYQQPGPSSSRPVALRSSSEFSSESGVGAARASSTTLHIDALLQAGRLRAEAEALNNFPPGLTQMGKSNRTFKQASLGSSYSISKHDQRTLSQIKTKSNPVLRPKGARGMLTSQTDTRSVFSGETDFDEDLEEEDEEGEGEGSTEMSTEDKAKIAARRTMARQRSLAVINRELNKEKLKYLEEEPLSPGRQPDTPLQGEFRPCHTPSEEMYEMAGNTPEEGLTEDNHEQVDSESPVEEVPRRQLRVVNTDEDVGDGDDEDEGKAHEDNEDAYGGLGSTDGYELEPTEPESGGLQLDVGDEPVLADLVPEERQELEEVMLHQGQDNHTSNAYDYGEDAEVDVDNENSFQSDQDNSALATSPSPTKGSFPTSLSLQRLPFLSEEYERERAAHIAATRTVNGSLAGESAISGMSEQESELGQVHEAVKRNISVKIPSRLLPLPSASNAESSTSPVVETASLGAPTMVKSSSISHSLLADARRGSSQIQGRKDSLSSISSTPRKGSSAMSPSSPGISMSRKESSNMGTVGHSSSPLRNEGSQMSITNKITTSPTPITRVLQKKNSFTFATLGSPIKVKSALPASPSSGSSNTNDNSRPSPGLSPKSLMPTPGAMVRVPSVNSHLRNQILPSSSSSSHSEGEESGQERKTTNSPDLESGDEGENGLPGLAPSIASDSASSEGHQLDSPTSMTYSPDVHPLSFSPNLSIPTSARKLLPIIPPNGNYQPFSVEEYDQKQMMNSNQDWRSSNEYNLRNQQILHVQTQTHQNQHSQMNLQSISHSKQQQIMVHPVERQQSLPIPIEEISVNLNHSISTPSSPTSSCHSILPSVKNKILQLENRDEALRKFSVSGSVPSSVVPSRQASVVSPSLMSINPSRQASIVSPSSISNLPSPMGMSLTTINERLKKYVINEDNNNNHGTSPLPSPSGGLTVPPTRKSYTTALAPKAQRTTSDDSFYSNQHSHVSHSHSYADSRSSSNTPLDYRYDNPNSLSVERLPSISNITNDSDSNNHNNNNTGIGHTTYINRRSFAYSPQNQNPNRAGYVDQQQPFHSHTRNQSGEYDYKSDSVRSRISNTSSTMMSAISPLNTNVPKLDPFGLGFASPEGRGVYRNESIRSNSTTASVTNTRNGMSMGNRYRMEPVKEYEGSESKTIKPKTSGFWDNEGGITGSPRSFNQTNMSPRQARVTASEDDTSESEGLL